MGQNAAGAVVSADVGAGAGVTDSSKMTETANVELRSRLVYEPQELAFGTSGRRGEVVHLTQLEVYVNALAELRYLQSLPASEGGIVSADEFYFGYDLRPSSSRYVPEQQGRGELAQAIEWAIRDAGMQPVNLGRIPTPAVAHYAISRGRGSIMVTGSHIPFDRNGYKTYTAQGELLKQHEEPIGRAVSRVRTEIYSQPFDKSPFNELGLFKGGHRALPQESNLARAEYMERYRRFFSGLSLGGQRILVYQHSSVGRDILVEILDGLGAEAIPAGRIDTFVALDTENVDEAMVAAVQVMADEAAEKHGPISGVVSLDGDADRPLILGMDGKTGKLKFFGGDLVGMVVAEYLGADAVVVPISCNDAIDRSGLALLTEPKTRIGSPYVIAGMEKARRAGRRAVCGWEANGGFLTGSDIEKNGKILGTLATRDAVLPILAVLMAAQEKGLSLAAVFEQLPKRFSRAALLKKFPRRIALEIVKRVSPDDSSVQEVAFDGETRAGEMETIRRRLGAFFTPRLGFGSITKLNYTDGVRITFDTGDVAHVRPSGNADEFRIYAVADTQERADFMAQAAVAEPDGILRLMERAFAG